MFIFQCAGSLLLLVDLLWLCWWGLLLLWSTDSRACRLGSCGTPAWLPGRHVGSSQTRDQTCVPCTGRTLNSWTTREVPRICLELGRSLGIDPTHGLRSFTHPSRHVPVSKCLRFSRQVSYQAIGEGVCFWRFISSWEERRAGTGVTYRWVLILGSRKCPGDTPCLQHHLTLVYQITVWFPSHWSLCYKGSLSQDRPIRPLQILET